MLLQLTPPAFTASTIACHQKRNSHRISSYLYYYLLLKMKKEYDDEYNMSVEKWKHYTIALLSVSNVSG